MLIETNDDNPVPYSVKIYNYPEIIQHIHHTLNRTGTLAFCEATNYCYLKILDAYIFDAFSLLENKPLNMPIKMPDYFTANNPIGAHISLVYPEENNASRVRDYIQSKPVVLNAISFKVNVLLSVNVFNKTQFVIVVTSPQLDAIRKKFDLPEKLNYHGLLVPFHITIATSYPQQETQN